MIACWPPFIPLELTEASMSRYTPVTSKDEMESEYEHVFD
jgi:hypothetical protein